MDLNEANLLQNACGVLDRASAVAISLLFMSIVYYAIKDFLSPVKPVLTNDIKYSATEDYGHFIDLEDECS